MICLAYDGSLNGDWVARYAIRFAAGTSAKTLQLFHVLDDSLEPAALDAKLEHLRRECAALGVELVPELLSPNRGVLPALLAALPAAADAGPNRSRTVVEPMNGRYRYGPGPIP